MTSLERLACEYGSSRSLAARLADMRPPRSRRAEAALETVVREGAPLGLESVGA